MVAAPQKVLRTLLSCSASPCSSAASMSFSNSVGTPDIHVGERFLKASRINGSFGEGTITISPPINAESVSTMVSP